MRPALWILLALVVGGFLLAAWAERRTVPPMTDIEATVTEPHKRKHNIRKGGYGENFATNRRTVWTH